MKLCRIEHKEFTSIFVMTTFTLAFIHIASYKRKLGANDAKYFAPTISFSENELNHIAFLATGKKEVTSILELNSSELEKFNKIYRKEERSSFIKNLKVQEEWQNVLKDEKDFQVHTTEVVVPKLNNGHYLIVATPDFSKGDFLAYKTIIIVFFKCF